MEIRNLQWDSEFFGLRIGRADIATKEDAVCLANRYEELKQQYDLLYIFDPNKVGFAAEGAKLVDEKILYSKPCEARPQDSDVTFFHQVSPSKDLYRLALISGGWSRFQVDKHLPEGAYQRLYEKWIENACPQEGTNKQILIYADADHIVRGMITVDFEGESGHIGLVAVDTEYQHQGIGGKIISTLDGYLFHLGVKTLEVPTQKANTDACRWYERNGFKIASITPIYHWWLQPADKSSILSNYGVTLRRLTHDKIEMLRQWRNDPKIQQFMFYKEYITPEMQERWFANLDPKCNYYYIIEYKGKEVGCTNVRNIDWKTKIGEPGIFIYDDDCLNSDVGARASLCLKDFIWNELKLDAITIEVVRTNNRAFKLNSALGYHEIPNLPGDPEDKIRMIMTREDAFKPNKLFDRLRRIFNKQ